MSRGSLVVLMLVFIGSAFVIFFHWRTREQMRPPAPDNKSAWQWVAAEPGSNVYLSPVGRAEPGPLASVWINRQFAAGATSVRANIIELHEFDCRRHTSRRLSRTHLYRDFSGADQLRTTAGFSGWGLIVPGTVAERVLLAACGNQAAHGH
jgi:hypothetical protein